MITTTLGLLSTVTLDIQVKRDGAREYQQAASDSCTDSLLEALRLSLVQFVRRYARRSRMRVPLRAAVLLLFLTVIAHAQAPTVPAPPTTPRRPVTDEYHGVKVVDEYRWLENWDDPEVKQWGAAQDARTHAFLDGLPSRQSIKERLKQLVAGGSPSYYYLQFRGGRLFAMKYQPPQQQPMLVALRSADDPTATVIFDPNATSATGSLSVDFYVPSFDGGYVAAAISENGSEDSSAHVFEVATGK